MTRVLVAGIGNVFRGDDAWGVVVARRLQARPRPQGVDVVDFGVRGFDLACALVAGYGAAVLLDTTRRGNPPGTLYILDLDAAASAAPWDADSALGGHDVGPADALALARALGDRVPVLRLVACEPGSDADDDALVERLTPPVAAAVDAAVPLVEGLVADLQRTLADA